MRHSIIILALLAALCSLACANTEIKHFKPLRVPKPDQPAAATLPQARKDHIVAALVPNLTPLTGPYETVEFETIYYQQNTVNYTNKERWYSLRALAWEKSYELRVSYAATTPSDFVLTLFTFDELLEHYGKSLTDISRASVQDSSAAAIPGDDTVMYARITALYAGVSMVPGLENQQVPYMLTLEKHVLGLPVQALSLILVLVIVIAVAFFVVSPRVLSTIDGIVAEEKLELRKTD